MEAISRVMGRIEAIQSGSGLGSGSFAAALASAERGESVNVAAPSGVGYSSLFGPSALFPVSQPASGIVTKGELDTYLGTSGVGARNGHLSEADLVAVSGAWDERPARLLPPAATSWELMRAAAARDGIDLRSIDSYRSWDAQAVGHEAYRNGEKAAYVAPPGHSEHGFGLAVDVTNGGLVGQGDVEWEWLARNGRRYGWHPISNETWHWEFRGV